MFMEREGRILLFKILIEELSVCNHLFKKLIEGLQKIKKKAGKETETSTEEQCNIDREVIKHSLCKKCRK